MHFSIPDTREFFTESPITPTTYYPIYINGYFHCCLRYKHLHGLHEQLRRCYSQLPSFPPKRLLPLTSSQLETRRSSLEHYLQLVGQDPKISKLELFQKFLLNAQIETAARENSDEILQRDTMVFLDVALMNGYQIRVKCQVGDNASDVMHKVVDNIKLRTHLMRYFCLYLIRKDANGPAVVLKRLMDFESPYLSRLQADACQIVIRKSYWDPAFDFCLLKDAVATNLLYTQVTSDVAAGWVVASDETLQKLSSLQEHGLKKEYIDMTRQLPLYGCLQFAKCLIDYPQPSTSALVSIGNNELSMRTVNGPKIFETKFRVTRMRCWRVTAMHNTKQDSTTTEHNFIIPKGQPENLQLSFEYLMSKQTLRWITITSSQAMLMSVCLQSMVDELLNSRDVKQGLSNTNNSRINGSSTQDTDRLVTSATVSSSPSTPSFGSDSYSSSSTSSSSNSSTSAASPTFVPVQFIPQQNSKQRNRQNPKISSIASYAAVFFRNGQDNSVQENQAFEGIGDNDFFEEQVSFSLRDRIFSRQLVVTNNTGL